MLRKNSDFSQLNDQALLELSLWVNLHLFSKGEMVIWEGDSLTGLHIIRKGSVKLFKTLTSKA
jgi:signal-transduction protein with cAMP-binding, CBS, and nucleotidyltransferase domain